MVAGIPAVDVLSLDQDDDLAKTGGIGGSRPSETRRADSGSEGEGHGQQMTVVDKPNRDSDGQFPVAIQVLVDLPGQAAAACGVRVVGIQRPSPLKRRCRAWNLVMPQCAAVAR